jgi:hypothetical protein
MIVITGMKYKTMSISQSVMVGKCKYMDLILVMTVRVPF